MARESDQPAAGAARADEASVPGSGMREGSLGEPEVLEGAANSDPPVKVPLALEDWATVIVMALLALITFANVVVRYLTDESFAWTEEFSIFLMIVLTMVAGSAAVARNLHIRIEFFADRGPERRQRALAQIAAAAMLLLFTVLGVLSIRVVWDDYRFGETSPGIGVPQWWYSIWLPLLSFAIALRAAGVWQRLRRRG